MTPERTQRYAVIPTHDREQDYQDCLWAISPQVDHVFVVSHNAPYAVARQGVTVLRYDEERPNISVMWNMGMAAAKERAAEHYVAVLNDDAIVSQGWLDGIIRVMFVKRAVAGCHDAHPDPRMAGYAFVLDGRAELMADEQFVWWYGDTDIERRAQSMGGVVKVPGLQVEHRHPNSTTVGKLAKIAEQDAQRFRDKWGVNL